MKAVITENVLQLPIGVQDYNAMQCVVREYFYAI